MNIKDFFKNKKRRNWLIIATLAVLFVVFRANVHSKSRSIASSFANFVEISPSELRCFDNNIYQTEPLDESSTSLREIVRVENYNDVLSEMERYASLSEDENEIRHVCVSSEILTIRKGLLPSTEWKHRKIVEIIFVKRNEGRQDASSDFGWELLKLYSFGVSKLANRSWMITKEYRNHPFAFKGRYAVSLYEIERGAIEQHIRLNDFLRSLYIFKFMEGQFAVDNINDLEFSVVK